MCAARGCAAPRVTRYRVEIVTPLSASTSPPVYPMPTWAERVYTRHFYDTWAERIVGVVTLLFMVATLVVAALFYAKRQSKIVKASNHLFCQLMFLGGLLLCVQQRCAC